MDERSTKIAELLHEAAENHHRVFRITDGADDDWASWYAEWLVSLSELPELLGAKVVRSELTYMLVRSDKSTPGAAWLSAGRTTTLASWCGTSLHTDADLGRYGRSGTTTPAAG